VIEAQVHRLATRLGMRDGEAYTVLVGVVVALVLAAVGLPGVFRDVVPAAIAEASAPARPSAQATAAAEVAAPDPAPAAAGLPAVAPVRPGAPASRSATPDRPSTAAERLPAPLGGRAAGERSVFAEVPDPGSPDGVAVAPDGSVYVTSDAAGDRPSALWAFSPTGALLDTWTAPGQAGTRARGLTGVAVDGDGTVWVVDAATARVLRLDLSADALVPVAEAADLPACGLLPPSSPCERGLVDSAPLLSAIAAGPDDALVVADRAQGLLWTVAGDELSLLAALDDRLAGDGPVGVSFVDDDELVVAVGARQSSFPPGLPALVQLRLQDGQATGPPTLVADLAVGEVPADVVAGGSGRAYVSLPASGTIADIGIDQGDRIDIRGDATEPAFAAPHGLALRARSLLVSDASDQLFDLAVEDRPVTRGPT